MTGHVSSYSTKAGTRWRIVYELPPGPDGRRRQTTKRGFTSKRKAQQALRAALGAIDEGRHVDPKRTTVGEYLRTWLDGVELKRTTRARYRQSIDCHLAPHIGGIRLQQLTSEDLDACYRTLAASGRRDGTGLAAKTIRNAHGVVHKALKDAVKRDHVVKNVATYANPPRAERNEMTVWTGEQLRTFLTHVRDDRLYAMWLVFMTTGMRRGEVLGLRWRNVDLDRGALTVEREWTVADGVAFEDDLKTRKSRRVIALDAVTLAALREHRARQVQERLALGPGYLDDGRVFCWPDGSPFHPHRPTKWLPKLATEAGLPRMTPHGLRHSYSTAALQAGVDVKVLSERLGHANTAITRDTYQHVLPEMDRQAADTVAAAILGGGA